MEVFKEYIKSYPDVTRQQVLKCLFEVDNIDSWKKTKPVILKNRRRSIKKRLYHIAKNRVNSL